MAVRATAVDAMVLCVGAFVACGGDDSASNGGDDDAGGGTSDAGGTAGGSGASSSGGSRDDGSTSGGAAGAPSDASTRDASTSDAGATDASIDTGLDSALADAGDDVADAAIDAPPPSNEAWPKTFDSTGSDSAFGAAVDSSDNVYFAISASGPDIDLLGGPVTPTSTYRGVIVSYTAGGAHRWSVPAAEATSYLAVGGGSLYTIAEIEGPGGVGDDDTVIARYTTDGVYQWTQTLTGAANQTGSGIAADAAGNVYISGWFNGDISFGGGNDFSTGGANDAFVASWDSSQVLRWANQITGTGTILLHDIAADAAGNTYATGSFADPITFAGNQKNDKGLTDTLIVSYDADGNERWGEGYGGGSNDRGERVAVNAVGTLVCMTGNFGGAVDFGSGNESSSGTFLDVYVACYSGTGTPSWSESYGGRTSGLTSARGIAIDGTDRVHAVGTHRNQNFFVDGNLVPSQLGTDSHVITFTSTGTYVASAGYLSSGLSSVVDVAAFSTGVFLDASFEDTVDWGDGPRVAANARDVAFVRWAP